MPLQEGWLFGEEIATITEMYKAQRAMTSLLSSKSKLGFSANKKWRSHERPSSSSFAQHSRSSGSHPQSSSSSSFKSYKGKGRGGVKGNYGGVNHKGFSNGGQRYSGHQGGSRASQEPLGVFSRIQLVAGSCASRKPGTTTSVISGYFLPCLGAMR
jgi:hypothetical protein